MVEKVTARALSTGNFKPLCKVGVLYKIGRSFAQLGKNKFKFSSKANYFIPLELIDKGYVTEGEYLGSFLIGDDRSLLTGAFVDYTKMTWQKPLVKVDETSDQETSQLFQPSNCSPVQFEQPRDIELRTFSFEEIKEKFPEFNETDPFESCLGREYSCASTTVLKDGSCENVQLPTARAIGDGERLQFLTRCYAYIASRGGRVPSDWSSIGYGLTIRTANDKRVASAFYKMFGFGDPVFFTRLIAANGFDEIGPEAQIKREKVLEDRLTHKDPGFVFFDSHELVEPSSDEKSNDTLQKKKISSAGIVVSVAAVAIILAFVAVKTGAFGWFTANVLTKLPLPDSIKLKLKSLNYKDNWFHRFHSIKINVNGKLAQIDPFYQILADAKHVYVGNVETRVVDYDIYSFLTVKLERFGTVYVHAVNYNRNNISFIGEDVHGDTVTFDTNPLGSSV